MTQQPSITPDQLGLLHHTLGLSPDRRNPYRNHFVASEGHHDYDDLKVLETIGLMVRSNPSPRFLGKGDIVFTCTDAGKQYAIEHLPPPPKRTQYDEYLRSESCDSLPEWLGITVPEYEFSRKGIRMVRSRRMPDWRVETIAGEWKPTKKEAKASYKEALHASKCSDRFYLACLRDTVGSNVSFHCKDGGGYHSDIDRAHTYTREEAQSAWERGREFDLPLCADQVDALAVWHVDSQLIPHESETPADCTKFVAFVRRRWNGNDVYWVREGGESTCDFALASCYEEPIRYDGWVWLPFDLADSKKRRTFDVNLIDRRKMIQSAGLVTPDHIKRYRLKNPNPKTRFNCPSCGRVNWQHNPYDFEGCSNDNCDKLRVPF